VNGVTRRSSSAAVSDANTRVPGQSVLARISRGELLSLLGVGVFGELLTVAWIATVLGVESGRATWVHAIGLAAVDLVALLWVPVPLFAWYDRFPLEGGRRPWNLLVRLVGALVILPVSSWTSAVAARWAGDALGMAPTAIEAMLPGYPEQLFWASCTIIGASLAYLVLRRLHNARDVEQRNAELQRLALEAQLTALAAELRPHFLFNALNNLAELVHQDPVRAEAMLLHLSSLLQATLAAGRQRTVSLAEELQHMDDYLALQQMRFDDRLQVMRSVDASALAARVPPMLLQPLVENAVVHGIEGRVGASLLQVTVRAHPGTLEVQVDDDGPGPAGSPHRGTGTGLRNVRERLAALYGEAAEAVLSERPGGGARVLLRLPLEVA
jgi:hypothetical protein